MRCRLLTHNRIPVALVLVLSLAFSAVPLARAEETEVTATLTVNSPADPGDGTCNAAECTLREAIDTANEAPNRDTIVFAIPGLAPHTILPDTALPDVLHPLIVDATTQPGYEGRPIVEINGSDAGEDENGLEIMGGGSTVRGLVINRFSASGIVLSGGGGNRIEGNYIGTGLSGATDRGNETQGILITGGSSGNIIGGSTPAAQNLISGNNRSGLYIVGAEATDNQLLGNLIGTDLTGANDLGNGTQGILISEASGTIIGGAAQGAGNLISGNNGHGIFINGISASGNQMLGNRIGTDGTGNQAIRNRGSGIYIVEAPNNLIGAAQGAGNLISGNLEDGIEIIGSSAAGNRIEGNFIGTNAAGTALVSNLSSGISIKFAPRTVIGGTAIGARNLISGNDEQGILLEGNNVAETQIQGNFIGTDSTGALPLRNRTGISISDAVATEIGGTTAGARNLISGNTLDGITINGTDSRIRGNYIGTNAAGTSAVPNGRSGISICVASNNVIGGSTTGARNLISGNGEDGIAIFSCGFTPGKNRVAGNYIGTDVAGTAPLGNARDGISIDATGHDNTIGGERAEQGNVIAFNGRDGISIAAPLESISATSNVILSNRIFSNGTLGIDLAPRGVNPNDADAQDTGPNQLQNFPVILSATSSSTGTTVGGTLTSTPETTFRVQLFANGACDPSGYGEGERYLGTEIVTTDGGGTANFIATLQENVPQGTLITATATDPIGNTSEFSECEPIVAPSAVTSSSFAVTASNAGQLARQALALLIVGSGVVALIRRRHGH